MRQANLIRSLAAIAAGLALTAGASAADAAPTILPDGSIRFDYGRRPQPLLVCKPQHVCDIALDTNETVLNLAIGDAARWVVAGGKSGPNGTIPHVFVKPTQSNLDTNIVITTTKRVYDIGLKSASDAPHPNISFLYADEDAAAKAAEADRQHAAIEAVLAGTPLVSLDRLDTKYKITGDPLILPDKVFNDGTRTYVNWKTLPVELPAVFSVPAAAGGAAQELNFRLVGSMYVIDNTSPNFDLVVAADPDRHGRPERRVAIRHQ